MSTTSRERFSELVRTNTDTTAALRLDLALLLIAAETLVDDDATGRALDGFIKDSVDLLDGLAERVPAHGRDDQRLRTALADFIGQPSDYGRLESSLLPAVLRRRRGLPILLSCVWTEVARRVDIPAYGVGLPGHFVVGVGDPDGNRLLVDPFAGGRLLPYDDARAITERSGRALRPEQLRPQDPIAIIWRVLTNIGNWASTPERSKHRLWSIELALALPHHDVGLRRERGEALAAVGRYSEASQELEDYADTVEAAMPLEAQNARLVALQARARRN